jgi:enoyl-CoA hydratase/carnithine racemase
MDAQVRTERDGRVMTVTLDNPPANFMTGRMVRELDDLVTSLEGDRSVGSVILTGAPEDTFITHFDVGEILTGSEGVGQQVGSTLAGGSLRAVGALARIPGAKPRLERSPAAGLMELRRIHELFLRMNRLDKVVIAAINGTALGGGCELALACDIRLMAQGPGRIGQPEMALGFPPGGGGTQRLSRILGPGAALEAMLEARLFTPQEAEALGVVHRTVPGDRLMAEARDVAERMARRSPAGVAALKRAVYDGASRPLAEGLHIERAGFLAAASTPASRRAMQAYVDQVKAHGGAPLADEETLAPWLDGTAVDLTTDG